MPTEKWTTATIVRQYLKGAGTSLTDAEIQTFIQMNEGLVEGILKLPADWTFDSASTKALPEFAVRKLVTLLSALDVIASTPQSFNSFTAINASTQVLVAQWNELIDKVNEKGFRDFFVNSRG